MMLREKRVCLGRRSAVIWWERDWPNRYITFTAAKEALFTFPLSLFAVCVWGGGEGVGWERHVGGGVG